MISQELSKEKNDKSIPHPSQFHKDVSFLSQLKLFKCPNYCNDENIKIITINDKSFVHLQCCTCNTKWYVCHNCPLQTKHFYDQSQLKRHVHMTCKNKTNRRLISSSTHTKVSKPKHCLPTTKNIQFDDFSKLSLFGRFENKMYYFYDQFNQGPHYLVGLSQYNLNNIAALLDTSEVHCHFSLAHLIFTQNPSQSELTTYILQYLHINLSAAHLRRKWACTVPLDIATMRRMYTEGKNSILTNIPHPNILELGRHSYVPLVEIIQDCLANDGNICDLNQCDVQYNENQVKNIIDCKVVKNLIKNIKQSPPSDITSSASETMHLMILTWSDDFEPNNIKQNKAGNSIWTFTVTVVSNTSFSKSEENTYIVSLGPKDDDHCVVERKFLEDLKHINSNENQKFYVASLKRVVKIKLHLIACVADLPERCNRCYISRGNSNLTTRWGYVSHVSILQSHLRSCRQCFQKNIEELTVANDMNMLHDPCADCLNWCFVGNNSLSNYSCPTGYPRDCNSLLTHKINFERLVEVVREAEYNFKTKKWSSNHVTLYLTNFGIQAKLIAKIIDNVDTISEDDIIELPPAWLNTNTSIDHWIDAPMHLLFLGVVKKTNSLIDKWATMFLKRKPLMQSFAPMLPFLSSMKLEWLKILPMCDNLTFGGFVSENWVALARIFCWMYSSLFNIVLEESVETESPSKPLKKWTGEEMRKWLVLRGLKRSGRVEELRQRIAKYLEHPENIPPVIEKYKCPGSIIRNTIVSMHSMISRLMQPVCNKKHIVECDVYIRVFLNCLSAWNKYATPKNNKPVWLSSYSYLNLLNIPKVMENYGPLRNYWEGSTMGEGILKRVKENYSSLRSGWHMNLTKRTLKLRSVKRIMNKLNKQRLSHMGEKIKEKLDFTIRSNNFHTYPDYLCLDRTYQNGQPISVIIDTQMDIYAIVTNDLLYQLKVKEYIDTSFGMNYFEFELSSMNSNDVLVNKNIFDYGVMLPRLTGGKTLEDMSSQSNYTVITSEWQQINKQKLFSVPDFEFEGDVDELFDDVNFASV